MLLPLPLRPWEIVGTKFLICLLYEYWIVLLLVLPLLLDAAVAAALIGAGYFGFRVLGIDIHLVTCVLLAVLAALTGIMRHILYTRGAAALSEIEI